MSTKTRRSNNQNATKKSKAATLLLKGMTGDVDDQHPLEPPPPNTMGSLRAPAVWNTAATPRDPNIAAFEHSFKVFTF